MRTNSRSAQIYAPRVDRYNAVRGEPHASGVVAGRATHMRTYGRCDTLCCASARVAKSSAKAHCGGFSNQFACCVLLCSTRRPAVSLVHANAKKPSPNPTPHSRWTRGAAAVVETPVRSQPRDRELTAYVQHGMCALLLYGAWCGGINT